MSEHPTAAELSAFLEGQLSQERRRAVMTHLVQGCSTCCRVAGSAFGFLPASPEDYHQAVSKVSRRVRNSVRRDRERAREAVAQIESGQAGTLRRRLHGLSLFEELLTRSWALRHDNPGKMVELARHATIVARTLDSGIHDTKSVADLQCRAWMELANAYRVAEDLEEAEQAFRRAETFFKEGSQNSVIHAHILNFRASYYGDRREFELALGALDTLLEIYRNNREEHLTGRTLIQKGLYVSYKGDPEEAVELTLEGLTLIEPDREPGLLFQSNHNLAAWLVQCGKLHEARSILTKNRWRQQEAGGRLNLLKLHWLEAQINAGLQEFDRAEHGFLEVKKGFLEVEKPYDAAVASLDLATMWLRQGRTNEAKAASLEAYDIFNSLGIRREGTGAFLVLMKAFQVGTATANLVKSVAEHLRKAQNDPTAKFEPPGE